MLGYAHGHTLHHGKNTGKIAVKFKEGILRTQNLISPVLSDFSSDEHRVWSLLKPGIPNDTSIAQEWVRARRHGLKIGPVLEEERAITENGIEYGVQHFSNAECWQERATETCTWYDERGVFTIPDDALAASDEPAEPPANDKVSEQAG